MEDREYQNGIDSNGSPVVYNVSDDDDGKGEDENNSTNIFPGSGAEASGENNGVDDYSNDSGHAMLFDRCERIIHDRSSLKPNAADAPHNPDGEGGCNTEIHPGCHIPAFRRGMIRDCIHGSDQEDSDFDTNIPANTSMTCDCLKEGCPGCHFPCEDCGRRICGHRCKWKRNWESYIEVRVQGKDIKRVPKSKPVPE